MIMTDYDLHYVDSIVSWRNYEFLVSKHNVWTYLNL